MTIYERVVIIKGSLDSYIYNERLFHNRAMTDIRKNDFKPSEFLESDEGYQIKVKKMDTGLTCIIDCHHDAVMKFFESHGYTPVWRQWDNESRKWKKSV